VHNVLRNKVEKHQRYDQLKPNWPVDWEELSKLINLQPIENTQSQNSEKDVDYQGETEKPKIDFGVFPFFITVRHEWIRTFKGPEYAQTTHQPDQLLPGRHQFEEEKKFVHGHAFAKCQE